MNRKEMRQKIISGLSKRRCPHGARRMTVDPNEAPVACIACVVDVLCDPLPEELAVQVAKPKPAPMPSKAEELKQTSWYGWEIVPDRQCPRCDGVLRIHPDAKRMVCRQGHVAEIR